MTENNYNTSIFFHVGLAKAASTYLQYRFFPHLQGVHYIQRTHYSRYNDMISKTNDNKYLVSREFDKRLETETKKFSEYYPHAKVIIVLRRHDTWIASQYRKYVKNGGHHAFENFFDIDYNKGVWKKEDIYFMPKIQFIEKCFIQKPLVIFYEDLKKNPFEFFDIIANYIGSTYDKKKISLKPIHTSYNNKQLKIIRRLSNIVFKKQRKEYDNKILHWLQRRSRMLTCYIILYSALTIPSSLIGKEKIIPDDYLEKIRKFFSDDWQQCLEYARKNN